MNYNSENPMEFEPSVYLSKETVAQWIEDGYRILTEAGDQEVGRRSIFELACVGKYGTLEVAQDAWQMENEDVTVIFQTALGLTENEYLWNKLVEANSLLEKFNPTELADKIRE